LRQQIIVSGIGGQGVLFLTRVIAQVAVNRHVPVLTAETHGMAQRGGTVLSTIKIGAFASPLVRSGQADVGLILWEANLPVHLSLLKPDGRLLVNAVDNGPGQRIDASGVARNLGNAVLANLVLLGFALKHQALPFAAEECGLAIEQLAPGKYIEQNLKAFQSGLDYAAQAAS
jgi:indolepyruvate ferredoxin oxidoreductase beta subunit